MEMETLVNVVRQTGFEAHVYLKNGFLEKIYENALLNRLRKKDLEVSPQQELNVHDEDGTILGVYLADLIVEEKLLVELKAVRELEDIHTAQVLAYLKATGLKHGMLMNFGNPKFQVKKLIL